MAALKSVVFKKTWASSGNFLEVEDIQLIFFIWCIYKWWKTAIFTYLPRWKDFRFFLYICSYKLKIIVILSTKPRCHWCEHRRHDPHEQKIRVLYRKTAYDVIIFRFKHSPPETSLADAHKKRFLKRKPGGGRKDIFAPPNFQTSTSMFQRL